MKEIINPVAGIKHIAIADIYKLITSQDGLVILKYSRATEIPFVKAGVSMNYNKSEVDAGQGWTTNLTSNLKSELPKLRRGILLIKLESGEQLVIGDINLPVKDLSSPESLMSKQIQISYKSWHKPYKIAV